MLKNILTRLDAGESMDQIRVDFEAAVKKASEAREKMTKAKKIAADLADFVAVFYPEWTSKATVAEWDAAIEDFINVLDELYAETGRLISHKNGPMNFVKDFLEVESSDPIMDFLKENKLK